MNKYLYIVLLIIPILTGVISTNACAKEKGKIWYIDWDVNSQAYLKHKIENIEDSSYSPQKVLDLVVDIKEINPKVILIKHDVAYVNIEGNPRYITNQSGTTGAWHFAAKVVFNLTEFKDIKYVYFVDEGAHFSSGKFERIDFWRLMPYTEKIKYKDYIENKLNAKKEDVAKYVKMLSEIGDGSTIDSLKDLKEQLEDVDYGGCLIDENEFRQLIDETIDIIKKRMN